MITVVHRRGRRVAGLLRYLWGPGRAEEHTDPRLVAAWTGTWDLSSLEPGVTAGGHRDVRALTALLEQPVRAGHRPPDRPVWHASMRLAPEDRDRVLSDGVWAEMATQMLTRAGIETPGEPGLRWIVMRHGDDHVHIVATLVREDGRTDWLRNDYRRCMTATYEVARRFGLSRRIAPADRTAPRCPWPAEINKARRAGRPATARDELRQRVRLAAAVSTGADDFFHRLESGGVLVRLRHSSSAPGKVTGYAVALPDDLAATGEPVYFGGGRLAPELTLPKLRRRWGSGRGTAVPPPAVRAEALRQAAVLAQTATVWLRTHPAQAQPVVEAAADLLVVVAQLVTGPRARMTARAAEAFDRAARAPYGRVAAPTGRTRELRSLARALWSLGRTGADDVPPVVSLLLRLVRLAEALAELRTAQQRLHQADAAVQAARDLQQAAIDGPVAIAATGAVTPPRHGDPGAGQPVPPQPRGR